MRGMYIASPPRPLANRTRLSSSGVAPGLGDPPGPPPLTGGTSHGVSVPFAFAVWLLIATYVLQVMVALVTGCSRNIPYGALVNTLFSIVRPLIPTADRTMLEGAPVSDPGPLAMLVPVSVRF